MMDVKKALKFLEYFSIITIGENKIPNFPWKKQQTEKLSAEVFSKNYQYSGGIFRSDGSEIPATTGFGICTGFEDLECVDVDLKVFSTAQEQRDFWDEYIQLLKDNILDFDDKVAIYKTKNAGYHLLYKTKRVEGNLKIAVLKDHKEAVIESRGIGGYVFTYPDNKAGKLSYFDLQYISDKDREVIMYISKMYNYVNEIPTIETKVKKEYNGGSLAPWTDYNNRTEIWSLVQDEFSIPPRGNKSNHILIKRHGSTSAYSGYIYKNSGCIYLFSTGTRYPHQTLLTPFNIYAIQNHGGDVRAAASELYKQGYGDRIQQKVKEQQKVIPALDPEEVKDIDFPIDIFPEPIQSYLIECNKKLDANIDYTGSAMLWLISVCVGNALEVEVKRGWTEKASLWISLVGKAGIGKTPSINKVIFPIEQMNLREIKRYAKEYAAWKEYDALGKKDKESVPEVKKPVRTQFIANDITTEALVTLHQESDNAVGVFKDELAGWLKDMNKYRAGSDLEFWLSTWSGKSAFMNRITREDSFIDKPFIPVLGGIQPSIFSSFYTDENKDNGFMDRMLISYPEASIEEYNENELDYDILDWYNNAMVMFYNRCKNILKYDEHGVIESYKVNFKDEAKKEWVRIFNKISGIQNSDEESEYLKSMYPKQKSYIPRFALLINTINAEFDNEYDVRYISKDSILKAERLSEYFVNCAKKVRVDNAEEKQISTVMKEGKTNADKIKLIFEQDPDFNRSKTAEKLGVSVRYVRQILKDLK